MRNAYNTNAVAIAGLLSDFGKIECLLNDDPSLNITEASINFFKDYIENKNCIKELSNEIVGLISNKDNSILKIISKAMKLDRESNKVELGKDYVNKPLNSILSFVEIGVKNDNDKNYVHLPKILNKNDIFAIEESDENKISVEVINNLKKVYEGIKSEIKSLPGNEIKTFVDSLLSIYEKYLCYVNSEIYSLKSDISLYDHLKTVSALSVCLNDTDKKEPFKIIAADLSGIQNFIYHDYSPVENSTRGLSKRLRGKSYYLSLLTDTFSEYLCDKFNVSRAHVLLNGGGHFILIVPNNTENDNIFDKVNKEIQLWFYQNFKGEINLVLESLEADEELYKNFPKWYKEISSNLIKAKKQKSFDILAEAFGSDLDAMKIDFGNLRMNNDKTENFKKLNSEYERNLFKLSVMFENIGKAIPNSKFIAYVEAENINKSLYDKDGITIIPFTSFNTHWMFFKDFNSLSSFIANANDQEFRAVKIYSINSGQIVENENLSQLLNKAEFPVSYGMKFIGSYAPKNKENYVAEFSEISKLNNEKNDSRESCELNYPLLAVLRMDVDNLGTIFSEGLTRDEGENLKTLSRVVSLSREFNQFFLGYINKLADRWDVYITYSGGDDLFVVGSWINIIGFAIHTRRDFDRFVCNNKNITISGGMYLCKDTYPVYRAAEYAGENEEKAKSLIQDKDCICAFDKVFKWEEFIKYIDYGKDLDALINSDDEKYQLKSGFIHFLLQQVNEMFDEEGEKIDKQYFKKLPLIKYLFARKPRNVTAKSIENNLERRDNPKINALMKLVSDVDSMDYLRNFVVPASYSILKNRDLTKKEK